MLVVGLDFEATGVDHQTARAIEVGAVIWESDTWKELEKFNSFIWEHGYPELTDKIIQLTGIKQDELIREGSVPKEVFKDLIEFIGRGNYIIAHNKEYDGNLLKSELRRHDFQIDIPESKWICSYRDVPYPERFRCKKLSHLTLDHGVPIDPKTLHRAVADVELIGKLFKAGNYTLESILEYRDSPWVYFQAIIPPPWEDGGKGKIKAYEQGYSYLKARGTDGPQFPKCWVKRVKAIHEEDEKRLDCPFKRSIIFREKITT